MDDAGEWKIMLKVALPMCRSSLIATMMFSVIGFWKQTDHQSLYLQWD